MLFKSYSDLAACINTNLWKIPHDIDGVIGVARSGMIPAAMIAEALNVGLSERLFFYNTVTSDSNVVEAFNSHGWRPLNRLVQIKTKPKFLVVDDTSCNGRETHNTKKIFSSEKFDGCFDFVYLVVYSDGPCGIATPDIILEDISDWYTKPHIFEWHLMTHPAYVNDTIFDLDGVICVDPPDERNIEAYESYLDNPIPFHIPSTSQHITIITYRMDKYRPQTERFLDSVGITNRDLVMYQAETYNQRALEPPWDYKARYYRANDKFKLFIESDELQATLIHKATGKPVYCVSTNRMF